MSLPTAKGITSAAQWLQNAVQYFIPGWGIGKTIYTFSNTMQKLAPRFQALKGIKGAIYKGEGLYSSVVRRQMDIFAQNLPEAQKGIMTKWLAVSSGKSIHEPLRQYETFASRQFGKVFYKTMLHDMGANDVQKMINRTFDRLGVGAPGAKGMGRLAGAVMNSKERAFNTAFGAYNTKELLTGPSLASNLPVLGFATLASTTTTASLIRALRRRGQTLYDGYEGNVF
jgi:hypothetical protein